jgi:hypothetical protein
VPGAQTAHDDNPGDDENCPTLQLKHVLAPLVFPNIPTPHSVHADEPVTDVKVPLVQAVQLILVLAPTIELAVPTGHTVQLVVLATLNVPAPHNIHVDDDTFQYAPAAHDPIMDELLLLLIHVDAFAHAMDDEGHD